MRTFCQILTPDIIKLLEKTEEKIAEIKNGGITSIRNFCNNATQSTLVNSTYQRDSKFFIHFCQTDH